MKKLIMATLLLCSSSSLFAQKYMTRTGQVSFYSATPFETIDAINNEVACIADAKNGDIVFQMPNMSFKFQNALMQEHFNENYMESDKYPKSTFKGKIDDVGKVNFSKDGTYNVTASGQMSIHGVTKQISVPGTITVKGKTVKLAAKFNVKPEDYNIKIPSLVASKIAKQMQVTVNTDLNQL